MLAKFALALLVGLGLLVVALAGAQCARIGSADAALAAALRADCINELGGVSGESPQFPQSGHLGWSAASWLVGAGLVAAVGRRRGRVGPMLYSEM